MFKEKLKMLIEKNKETGDKKKIENLVILVVILVITLIAINAIWSEDSDNEGNTVEDASGYKVLAESTDYEDDEDELEKKLEEILAKMEGVGEVSVMITYSQESEIVPMQNETSTTSITQETDSDGGTRTIEEKETSNEILYSDGIEIKTVINPIVKGAIVIAEGASNATVKTNIVSAVEAITGLATYKVQVFEMN